MTPLQVHKSQVIAASAEFLRYEYQVPEIACKIAASNQIFVRAFPVFPQLNNREYNAALFDSDNSKV